MYFPYKSLNFPMQTFQNASKDFLKTLISSTGYLAY